MTLMQLHLSRRRALLCTDTHVWTRTPAGPATIRWPDGAPVLVSKVHVLPHLRAALTLVGSGLGFDMCADHLRQARDFPDAINTLAEVLQQLRGHPGLDDRDEVMLVGWHPEHQSMVLARFTARACWALSLAVPPGELTGQFLHPRPEGLPIPATLDHAEAYALATVRQVRAADPWAGLGGQLITAELTAEGVQMRYGPDLGATPLRPGAQVPTRTPAAAFAIAHARHAHMLPKAEPADAHFIVQGGGVELQFGPAGSDPSTWQSVKATDGQSGVFLGPVQDGNTYLIRARAYNRLAAGTWTPLVAHQVVGKTAAPANVSGLAASLVAGAVLITVTPSTEADVVAGGALELRTGASWAAGTRIFRGPADRYTWAWPAAGTYTIRAKWIDSSGNESATDTTTSVTVDERIGVTKLGETVDAGPYTFTAAGSTLKAAVNFNTYGSESVIFTAAVDTKVPLSTSGSRYIEGTFSIRLDGTDIASQPFSCEVLSGGSVDALRTIFLNKTVTGLSPGAHTVGIYWVPGASAGASASDNLSNLITTAAVLRA